METGRLSFSFSHLCLAVILLRRRSLCVQDLRGLFITCSSFAGFLLSRLLMGKKTTKSSWAATSILYTFVIERIAMWSITWSSAGGSVSSFTVSEASICWERHLKNTTWRCVQWSVKLHRPIWQSSSTYKDMKQMFSATNPMETCFCHGIKKKKKI